MEFVTKKIPKRTVPKIRQIQARRMLRLRRRVSEAEVIAEAVEELEKKEERQHHGETQLKTLDAIDGFFKARGGKKVKYSTQVDEIVYGSAKT